MYWFTIFCLPILEEIKKQLTNRSLKNHFFSHSHHLRCSTTRLWVGQSVSWHLLSTYNASGSPFRLPLFLLLRQSKVSSALGATPCHSSRNHTLCPLCLALYYDKAVGWLFTPNPSILVRLWLVTGTWFTHWNALSWPLHNRYCSDVDDLDGGFLIIFLLHNYKVYFIIYYSSVTFTAQK